MLTHVSVMANKKIKHTTISINPERVDYIIDSHIEGSINWIIIEITGTNLISSFDFILKSTLPPTVTEYSNLTVIRNFIPPPSFRILGSSNAVYVNCK